MATANMLVTVQRNDINQREYWDNRLLEIIKLNATNYVFVNLGREVTVPKNEGTTTIKMRRYNALPIRNLAVGAVDETTNYNAGEMLREGLANTPLKVEAQQIDATLDQFGAWIEITDRVQDIHMDDIKTIYQPELADHAAKVRELNVLAKLDDASEWYGADGTATTITALTPPTTEDNGDVLTIKTMRRLALIMKNYNRMGHPRAGGKPLFVVHSNVMHDLLDDQDLKDRLLDPGQENAPIKIGTLASYQFYGLTVMETLLAEVQTVTPQTGNAFNVYTSYLLGKDPYVVTKLGAGAVEWKMTGFEAEKTDPLGQIATFGYRMWTGAKVIDPLAITKIYNTSNYDVLADMDLNEDLPDYDYTNKTGTDDFGRVADQEEEE